MQRYKRNQVEEAIAAALQQAGSDAGADLRTRLKRLLDTDATLRRDYAGKGGHGEYAFSTGERPGRGLEVWFSPYDAFALFLGVLLLEHRWPQQTAVRIMRQARPTLEPEHGRILSFDPEGLFNEEQLTQQASPGQPAVGTIDPVFLAIVSGGRTEMADPEARPRGVRVCRGEEEVMRFWRARAPAGTSITVIELTATAHRLAYSLAQTRPRARGRSSR
jgi:hypothetical protein